MHNKSEIDCLAECRRQIERRLGWGDSGLWTSRDFEQLSETIREATQVHLSTTTLKRIWGKVKYDSLPAVTTLDTLAQFAGHHSWRALRQEVTTPVITAAMLPQDIPAAPSTSGNTRRNWIWVVAGAGLVLSILGFYFSGRKSPPREIVASQYRFSSKKVLTEGVPNSVVFDYDATASPVDSVFIQQSWDPARRQKISRDQRQYTSVYYYPGFFKARLIVGRQMVKEHDLLIRTRGWLPVIEQTPLPVYFEEKEARSGNELGLSIEKIAAKNIPLQPRAPWVRYSNVGNWGDLRTDSFRLETDLINDYREGSAICQQTEIRLLCEDAAIIIPLCGKGCVSELNLLLLDKTIPGKTQDLSFLGVDFHHWIHVVIVAAGGQFRLFLDNKLVFQSPLPAKSFKIEGVDFRFQGTGRIRDMSLRRL